MDFYKGNIPILDADGPTTALSNPPGVAFGCVPRDYAVDPLSMRDAPSKMQVYEESDWDALYDEQEANESSLEHIYLSGPGGAPAFVNLDQNGHGYCWAYSVGHAIMLDRLKRNLAPIRLNPHATAAIIKGGADEGGWCGLSTKFGQSGGYAVEGTGPGEWPLHSRNLKYDRPALRLAMAKYKVTEDWFDIARDVWDQKLNRKQVATCGFANIPAPSDFNWWGHSVCQVRWVRIEANSWGPLILNSWKGWGRYGLAVLRGSQATADGAVGVRVTTAS